MQPKPCDAQTTGRRQYLENGRREAAALLFQPCRMHRPGPVKERQASRASMKCKGNVTDEATASSRVLVEPNVMDRSEMVAAFEELRPLLFSIAYRMLGSVSEAEEIVQETFLRWHRASTE